MASFTIVPHLWYTKEAEEAARFYVGIFPDSRIDAVTPMPTDTPSGPAGSVNSVEFTLSGQPFVAFSGGPFDAFNHAISLMVVCEDQAEIDRYWEALGDGGTIEQCGWLRDRYGVVWQIAPRALIEMLKASDRAASARAAKAMMEMVKLDIAALQRAFRGE